MENELKGDGETITHKSPKKLKSTWVFRSLWIIVSTRKRNIEFIPFSQETETLSIKANHLSFFFLLIFLQMCRIK